MKVIVIEQENKEEIQLYPCVTCMWAGHKNNQIFRSTCIKLYDYRGNCFQICENCLEKVYSEWKKRREEFPNRMKKCLEEKRKKRGKVMIKEYRCPKCKRVTATTGHIPKCKCSGSNTRTQMEEINKSSSNKHEEIRE